MQLYSLLKKLHYLFGHVKKQTNVRHCITTRKKVSVHCRCWYGSFLTILCLHVSCLKEMRSTREKWLTASLPFVLDMTCTVPLSFSHTVFLRTPVWAMLSVSFTAASLPLLPQKSKPLPLSFFSSLTHLRLRLGSWRRRWSRPLQQSTRSPWTYKGKTVFHLFLCFHPPKLLLKTLIYLTDLVLKSLITWKCYLDESGHVL